jgi:Flp pilus assembly protein TadB
MDFAGVQAITAAAAPIVMVSAAGLLFMGIQTKNLHLSDRLRALTAEHRNLSSLPAHAARRRQIEVQLALFSRRIRLSQMSLESLYLAILCFMLTALLLVIVGWVGQRVTVLAVGVIFVVGVTLVLLSLALEFLEMRLGLQTIDAELERGAEG